MMQYISYAGMTDPAAMAQKLKSYFEASGLFSGDNDSVTVNSSNILICKKNGTDVFACIFESNKITPVIYSTVTGSVYSVGLSNPSAVAMGQCGGNVILAVNSTNSATGGCYTTVVGKAGDNRLFLAHRGGSYTNFVTKYICDDSNLALSPPGQLGAENAYYTTLAACLAQSASENVGKADDIFRIVERQTIVPITTLQPLAVGGKTYLSDGYFAIADRGAAS